MTTELEDAVRESLHSSATRLTIAVPPIDEVIGRPAPKQHVSHLSRVALVAAIVVFIAAIGGLAVVMARTGTESPPAAEPPPVAGPLGQALGPGALITAPAGPGWTLRYFAFVPYDPLRPETDASHLGPSSSVDPDQLDPGPYVEYRFANTDGRTLQVSFYTVGKRSPQVTTPEPPLADVRGTTGYSLEYGSGRFRIDWDESGRTWEADGQPFSDLSAFADELGQIPTLSENEWRSVMPAGVADAVLTAQAGEGLSWYPDKGTNTFPAR